MSNFNDENMDWSQWLEKPVCVKGTLFGTLKYFGKTHFKDGLWCGIELDKPVGKNNGAVENVQYFTCSPNFGIFVPVFEVSKLENQKPLNSTFTNLNKTFEIHNFQAHISPSVNSETILHYCNKVDETGEIKERLSSSESESEESLGILDPGLVEESFELDSAIHNVSSFCEKAKKQVQEDVYISTYLPSVKDIFSEEINNQNCVGTPRHRKLDQDEVFICPNAPSINEMFSGKIDNPIYASTPRHPQAKRFVDFNVDEICLLDNINKNDCVFDSPCHLEPVFFDEEKLKNNPSLTSTSKVLFESPISSKLDINSRDSFKFNNLNKTEVLSQQLTVNEASTSTSKAFESPISSKLDINNQNTFKFDNLNKTEVLSDRLTVNEASILATDLNKTRTVTNTCDNAVNNTEVLLSTTFELPKRNESFNLNTTIVKDTDFRKTVLSQIEEVSESYQSCNLNATFDLKRSDSVVPVKVVKNSEADLIQVNNVKQRFSIDSECKLSDNHLDGINKNVLEQTFILDPDPSEILNKNEDKQIKIRNEVYQNSVQSESFDNKNKFLEETSCPEKSLSNLSARRNTCSLTSPIKSHVIPNRLSDNFNLNSSLNRKGNVPKHTLVNRKSVSIAQPKYKSLEKVEFKKPLSFSSSIHKPKSSIKKPSSAYAKGKANTSFSCENVTVQENSSLVSKINLKTSSSCSDVQSKILETELSVSLNQEDKFNKNTKITVKSRLSHVLSYTQSSNSAKLSNNDTLPLADTSNKSSNMNKCDKVKPPFSKLSSTFGLKPPRASLSSGRKSMFEKKSIEQVKAPDKKQTLQVNGLTSNLNENIKPPMPRQSIGCPLGASSVGCGIPKRKSLAPVKTSLPVGVVKPRNSLLPSVKEKTLVESEGVEAVPTVKSSSACMRRSSRQLPLPQKSQIASTRKVGLKYGDVKEVNDANPKIPRYNLRGKS